MKGKIYQFKQNDKMYDIQSLNLIRIKKKLCLFIFSFIYFPISNKHQMINIDVEY